MTGVKGVSGDASTKLHLGVGPSDDISSEVAAAGGQAVDVTGGQDVWPHVQVRHLTHKWLSGIKTASQSVLKKRGQWLCEIWNNVYNETDVDICLDNITLLKFEAFH